MPADPMPMLAYRRARFATRLPLDRRYAASHYWLKETSPTRWQIGFTKFATRMLGDLVEYDFSVGAGDSVGVGQAIGTVEGFKAVATLFGVVDGTFAGGNPALAEDPTLADRDPYGQGWLYEVKGAPDPAAVDAAGYAALLDGLIDRLLQESQLPDGDPTCFKPDMS